jgi:hypothetical protein
MVKRKSSLVSTEGFQVRILVGVLESRPPLRGGLMKNRRGAAGYFMVAVV